MKRMFTRIASMSLIAVMCVPHNANVYADDIRDIRIMSLTRPMRNPIL